MPAVHGHKYCKNIDFATVAYRSVPYTHRTHAQKSRFLSDCLFSLGTFWVRYATVRYGRKVNIFTVRPELCFSFQFESLFMVQASCVQANLRKSESLEFLTTTIFTRGLLSVQLASQQLYRLARHDTGIDNSYEYQSVCHPSPSIFSSK